MTTVPDWAQPGKQVAEYTSGRDESVSLAEVERVTATCPDLDQYGRAMHIATAPMTVSCPQCRAPRGGFCKSASGYNVAFHARRRRAVAHLTDDQRIEAVAQMRAQQDQTRDATIKQLARAKEGQ